jgi:hypothetical protein
LQFPERRDAALSESVIEQEANSVSGFPIQGESELLPASEGVEGEFKLWRRYSDALQLRFEEDDQELIWKGIGAKVDTCLGQGPMNPPGRAQDRG